jgi:8-amino-7-oxononanoate synthase
MTSLNDELEILSNTGLLRNLTVPFGSDYASNDFFGLTRSKIVRAEIIKYLENNGAIGSTGSRLISGQYQLLRETEEFLAQYFRCQSALFFGSGYLANLGVTFALASQDCEFFSDELIHASLIDGMKLSKTKISIYRHNDMEHLRVLLKESDAKRKIVITESIFSMNGDSPNLNELRDIINEFAAYLIIDEAHATGICGNLGLGLAQELDFNSESTIIVHTCGKALGGYGAFVLTSHSIRNLIINKARSFIYSTAPSPIHVLQTRAALTELHSNPIYRQNLSRNIELMNKSLMDFAIVCPSSHILTINIAGNDRVTKAAEFLQRNNFFIRAIRSPTVALGTERLRITVKSFHDPMLYNIFAQLLTEILP